MGRGRDVGERMEGGREGGVREVCGGDEGGGREEGGGRVEG